MKIIEHHHIIIIYHRLVVYLPLWKIWKSVGIIIPNIWKVLKFMFQTTNQIIYQHIHGQVDLTSPIGQRPVPASHISYIIYLGKLKYFTSLNSSAHQLAICRAPAAAEHDSEMSEGVQLMVTRLHQSSNREWKMKRSTPSSKPQPRKPRHNGGRSPYYYHRYKTHSPGLACSHGFHRQLDLSS